MRRITPARGLVRTKIFGSEIELDLADHIQRSIYLGTFEPEETALVSKILRPGMTVVDVGANVGYFTLMAARAVGPSGKVAAFEPSPGLFKKLSKTVADNGLSHVELNNSGLGEQPGFASLYLNPSFRNNTPTMVKHAATEVYDVPIMKLDDYLGADSTVDLLKIDVEGFEPQVLSGAMGALSTGRIKTVLCEFNSPWLFANGSSPDALWQMLVTCGFREHNGSVLPPAFTANSVTNHVFFHRGSETQTKLFPITCPACNRPFPDPVAVSIRGTGTQCKCQNCAETFSVSFDPA